MWSFSIVVQPPLLDELHRFQYEHRLGHPDLGVQVNAGSTAYPYARTTGTALSTSTARVVANRDLMIMGNVGIGMSNPGFALEVKATPTNVARFTGSAATSCTLSTGGIIACTSDARLKKDIATTTDALATILQLRPVSFRWNLEDPTATSSHGLHRAGSREGPPGPRLDRPGQRLQDALDDLAHPLPHRGHPANLPHLRRLPSKPHRLVRVGRDGITKLFAQELVATRVYGDELCAKTSQGGYVCITGDQLGAVLSQIGAAAAATSAAPSPSDPATSSPQIPSATTSPEATQIPQSGNANWTSQAEPQAANDNHSPAPSPAGSETSSAPSPEPEPASNTPPPEAPTSDQPPARVSATSGKDSSTGSETSSALLE